ncbi:unnamed protein product [Larinioides sclopetarius]|uniref:Uncharacterized protein n=1 Tax=Larinioides sclopetarius TaxID=280406 RepID=A0AAV2B233_9ARAC
MPPRNGKKSRKEKKKDSGSSTPQSSVPSVEDETQRLLPSGACGSSGSRESRAASKAKRDGKKTSPISRLFQSPGATSSRNAPQPGHSSEKDLLIPPDPESSTCSSRSSSKRSPIKSLKSVISKMSPNRSSDSKCCCPDKKAHEPKCPEVKTLAAKDRSPEGKLSSNESKPSSSSESPIIAKKSKKGTQSSSSSDAEYLKKDSKLEGPLEKSLLTVRHESAPKSPSKMSTGARVKNFFRSKSKSPNRPSDAECSCGDKSDHEAECPERRKQKTDSKMKSPKARLPSRWKTKSEESSSSGSPIMLKKNKHGDISLASSDNSKMSSNSGHDAVESSSSNEGNRALERSSDNKCSSESKSDSVPKISIDCDPQEGTSSGPARDEQQRPYRPVPRSRTKSHETCLRILGSSRSPSPFRHSWEDEASMVRDANTERGLPAGSLDDADRSLLRLTLTVRPDLTVRRTKSHSPVRVRDCSCGAGNRGYRHKDGCSRMVDARARRKCRRCRQDVLISKRYNMNSEDDE